MCNCKYCYNARIDDSCELTDSNDYSACCIGNSLDGFRMMLCSGGGKSLKIELDRWHSIHGWTTLGVYSPKYCPECGRKITEYD